jgi:serine/threonine-protein kinase
MDPVVARQTLRRAGAVRDKARGLPAFYALVERDPEALHDPALAIATRDLAAAVALAPGDETDRLFDTLAQKVGADGLDILYEIVRVRGGSKAAARAEAALRGPGVMDKATTALRVTWTLREAPCAEKAALLDKAATEGDLRTLVVMETTTRACLGPASDALKAAILKLKLRLR